MAEFPLKMVWLYLGWLVWGHCAAPKNGCFYFYAFYFYVIVMVLSINSPLKEKKGSHQTLRKMSADNETKQQAWSVAETLSYDG